MTCGNIALPAALSPPIEGWTVRSFSKLHDKLASPVSGAEGRGWGEARRLEGKSYNKSISVHFDKIKTAFFFFFGREHSDAEHSMFLMTDILISIQASKLGDINKHTKFYPSHQLSNKMQFTYSFSYRTHSEYFQKNQLRNVSEIFTQSRLVSNKIIYKTKNSQESVCLFWGWYKNRRVFFLHQCIVCFQFPNNKEFS